MKKARGRNCVPKKSALHPCSRARVAAGELAARAPRCADARAQEGAEVAVGRARHHGAHGPYPQVVSQAQRFSCKWNCYCARTSAPAAELPARRARGDAREPERLRPGAPVHRPRAFPSRQAATRSTRSSCSCSLEASHVDELPGGVPASSLCATSSTRPRAAFAQRASFFAAGASDPRDLPRESRDRGERGRGGQGDRAHARDAARHDRRARSTLPVRVTFTRVRSATTQHTDDGVLAKREPRCDTADAVRAIRRLKDAAFKVDVHLMPCAAGLDARSSTRPCSRA